MDRSLFFIEFAVMMTLGGLLVQDHFDHKGDEELANIGSVAVMIGAIDIVLGILSIFIPALAA